MESYEGAFEFFCRFDSSDTSNGTKKYTSRDMHRYFLGGINSEKVVVELISRSDFDTHLSVAQSHGNNRNCGFCSFSSIQTFQCHFDDFVACLGPLHSFQERK